MSGICGIVNFDGAPVDPALLRRMAEAAAYRGPDGITYWIEGNVGLAHLALHTTPESLRERQPLVNRRGDAILTADARVDNRDELIRTLTARGYLEDKDPTDADLILAAYECWGGNCPKEIIGDYAFAIWNAARRELYCVRDALGVRPFHYYSDAHTFRFASNVGSIVDGLAQRPEINMVLLEDMLAGVFDRWVNETVYQKVFRLPQSYCLLAAFKGVSLTRYWTIGAQPGPVYKDDAEYTAHFRELLKQAVRANMRCVGPLALAVSGGLDSSSIACIVEHMIAEEGLPIEARLYSYVFDRTPKADEREYLDAVIEACPHLEATLIPGDDCWGLREFADDHGYPFDEPEVSIDRALLLKLLRQIREDGCRVGLWGSFGDHLLTGGDTIGLRTCVM